MSKSETMNSREAMSSNHSQGSPTPIGKKFMEQADLWRSQHGYPAIMPLEAQNSAWREAGLKFGNEIVVDTNVKALTIT